MLDWHRPLQTGVPPASLQATTSYLPCKLLGATNMKMFDWGWDQLTIMKCRWILSDGKAIQIQMAV